MKEILVTFRGSIAHGMHNPNPDSIDDIDTIGIFVAPVDHYLGMKPVKETMTHMEGRIDHVQYELRHFTRLATNCNPNVMTILECDMVISSNWAGDMLRKNKEMFYSKKAFPAFEGYAHSQLQRMERNVFEGYQGKKRKKLFAEFGYDCKNAAHAIRLARMGCEFFETGLWRLDREDSIELLDIKNGKWSKEQVETEFYKLIPKMEAAKERSSLPNEPDFERINDTVKLILKATL